MTAAAGTFEEFVYGRSSVKNLAFYRGLLFEN